MRSPKQPFYGVDGNLLVEHLPYSHKDVEAVLNGTFVPQFYAHQFLPSHLMRTYPQLRDERAKRKHRRENRAKLEAKRQR
jgi:hypothetical protein